MSKILKDVFTFSHFTIFRYLWDVHLPQTTHHTLVKKKLASKAVCKTENDYNSVAGLTTYFPVQAGEEVEGDEIVVFDSAQVLPRYVVHYSIHQKQIS